MNPPPLTKQLVLLGALLLIAANGWAQADLPEKRVSLIHTNQPLLTVLGDLQKKYGLFFSYFNDPTALQKPVSIRARHQPLKTVLNELLVGTNIQYQFVGNQIVLKENKHPYPSRLKGKVIDKLTRTPLVSASVVVDQSLGTVTDEQGSFLLSLPDSYPQRRIVVTFVGYRTAYLPEVNPQSGEVLVEMEQQSQVLDEVVVNEKGQFHLLPKSTADILEKYEKDTIRFVEFPEGRTGDLIIEGKVLDPATRQPVLFCKISLPGYQTRVVTSLNGTFKVRLPAAYRRDTLVFSSLVYQERRVPIAALRAGEATVWLPKRTMQGEEVIAKLGEHHLLVELGIANIARNYTPTPSILEERYRETIKLSQTDTYLLDAEAALHVYKPAYRNQTIGLLDQMQMMESPANKVMVYKPDKKADWAYGWMLHNMYSIDGLDIVKGPSPTLIQSSQYLFFSAGLLSRNTFRDYRFQLLDVVVLLGKPVYVLGFEPSALLKSAYFQGRLYVEVSSLAFVRSEYQLTPGGLHVFNHPTMFTDQLALSSYPPMDLIRREYTVDYTPYQGYWCFDRASIENEYTNNLDRIPVTSRITFEVNGRKTENAKPFKPLKKSLDPRMLYKPFLYQIK